MTQNLSKNTSGTVTSYYQVNLAIDSPNITEDYINSHFIVSLYLLLSTGSSQEEVDLKIVDWDVKRQHKHRLIHACMLFYHQPIFFNF